MNIRIIRDLEFKDNFRRWVDCRTNDRFLRRLSVVAMLCFFAGVTLGRVDLAIMALPAEVNVQLYIIVQCMHLC